MSKIDGVIAVVDGSYDKETQFYSYGVVISSPDGTELAAFSGREKDETNEWQIPGELLSATKAIEWAHIKGYRKILIKHDYEGTEKFATAEYKAKGSSSTNYVQFLAKLEAEIDISYEHASEKEIKPAHNLARRALDKE
ncbi:hypothetical protein FACS1894103_3300 [Campylobacterota bacterium]|nr:hypothetical protein FACS1894103_3300 [Campylobacterota bacterium]